MSKSTREREVQPWGRENPAGDWREAEAARALQARNAKKNAAAADVPAKIDGRVARSQRTRAAVLDALIGLIDEGHFKPPAKVIAERSGVSTRSIFQHFPDLETLFSAAVQRSVNRFAPTIQPIPSELPVQARLERLVRQRFDLFEQAGNAYRAGLLDEPISTTLQALFRHVEYAFRIQVEVTFKAELAALRKPKRDTVVRQIAAVTGFNAWYALRRVEALDLTPAQTTMGKLLRTLLPE